MIVDAEARLERLLGREKSQEIMAEVLEEIGRPSLQTADDVYLFAVALDNRGGLLSAIGSALKIKAILSGASREA